MKEQAQPSRTSLPNHLFFNQSLNQALASAKRRQQQLALLFIDVDNFAKLQTTYGTETANLALEELEQKLRAVLRQEDILARLENDEFALVLADFKQPQVLGLVADKLLQNSLSSILIQNEEIELKLSIGIAIYPNDGESLEDLEEATDKALFKAKQNPVNSYQFANPQMTLEAEDYKNLQKALRQGLAKKEFILYYQPKLELHTQTITGVEALLRWDHPQYGILNPASFMHCAEESGLMIELGQWILREACFRNKQWQEAGYQPISISVNLSPQQFHHPQMTSIIEQILEETEMEPQYLELEITEMTVMDDIYKIREFLNHLKAKGIAISLDDFGTGNTSIRYLQDFPITTLKMDQSYIKALPHNQVKMAILTDMISLAKRLGIKVVVEGVETFEQLQFLAEQHCDYAQGYFISRPLPAGKMEAMLRRF